MSIDIDTIPSAIRNSVFLNERMIGLLASVEDVPLVDPAFSDDRLKNIVQYYSISPAEMEKELHIYAAALLNDGNVYAAWQILLSGENI